MMPPVINIMRPSFTTNSLSIVQLNMGRNSAVNLELNQYCVSQGVDVALVQEPYTNRGRLVDLHASTRFSLSKGERRAGNNSTIHGAAIVVFNRGLQVIFRPDLSTENFAVATVSAGNSHFHLISAYFKYRTSTATHLTILDGILDTLPHYEVVIAADVNAHSSRWFSDHNDPRGLRVSNFIDEKGLFVINSPSLLHTFRGPRGSSNIDVTLASNPARITGWSILHTQTSSDHATIVFRIVLDAPFVQHDRTSRYDVRRANWDTFSSVLISEVSSLNTQSQDLNFLASELTQAVKTAADAAIPKLRPRKAVNNVGWWTPLLANLRRTLRRESRVRHSPGGGFTAAYLRARNLFTAEVRRAKLSAWKAHYSKESANTWG